MADDSVILEWQNYTPTSSTTFQKLYNDRYFTDVTVACENNKTIEAHKVILSACSNLFGNILQESPHPHPLIYLQGIHIEDLMLLKKFIYLGKATVLQSQLDSFMNMAKTFLISKKPSDIHSKTLKSKHAIKVKNSLSNHSHKHETSSLNKQSLDLRKSVDSTDTVEQSNEESYSTKLISTKPIQPKYKKKTKIHCQKCVFTTVHELKLFKHNERRHMKKTCTACQLEFDDILLYNKHIRKQHTTFQCEECSYTTKWSEELQRHSKKHNGKMIHCDQCESLYSTMRELRLHKDSKHDMVEYNCDKCDYKAHTSRSMKFHEKKIHEGIRFPCQFCDYKATKKANLRIHQNSVHSKMRYECQFCKFVDAQMSRVRLHERRQHSKIR